MSDYKAASERTDEAERLLIAPFERSTWPTIQEQVEHWRNKEQGREQEATQRVIYSIPGAWWSEEEPIQTEDKL